MQIEFQECCGRVADAHAGPGTCGRRRRHGHGRCLDAAASGPTEALSPAAHTAVLEALDDEYKARAFYLAILERFPGALPFAHIVEAEGRHAAALGTVLGRRGLPVPADPHAGSEAIRRMVPPTLACACEIAAQAEIDNIDLYDQKLMPQVAGYPDVEQVFARLSEASRDRHLPAFLRAKERYSMRDESR